jgi:hypothetical protein
MDFVDIMGVTIVKQEDSSSWKFIPLLRHSVQSMKTVQVVYRFQNSEAIFAQPKPFSIFPKDPHEIYAEEQAAAIKGGSGIWMSFEGKVRIEIYMNKELNSAFEFTFDSYHYKSGMVRVCR